MIPNKDEMFKLIDQTESMNDQEKHYWKDVWDSIQGEHKARLYTILSEEKRKLQLLEEKYRGMISELSFDEKKFVILPAKKDGAKAHLICEHMHDYFVVVNRSTGARVAYFLHRDDAEGFMTTCWSYYIVHFGPR